MLAAETVAETNSFACVAAGAVGAVVAYAPAAGSTRNVTTKRIDKMTGADVTNFILKWVVG
jgi:hypothetical protein